MEYSTLEIGLFLLSPTPTLMACTGVTNAHGPLPQQQHAGRHHAV